MPEAAPSTFRLVVVPGVTPDRWSRTWSERLPGVELQLVPVEAAEAAGLLAADPAAGDGADAGLARLPVDPDTFHAIPLYTETTVVVVPRDHVLTVADELTMADLADERLIRPADDVLDWTGSSVAPAPDAQRPASTALAVELVAAGVGALVVPLSLARMYHRRDVAHRVVTDAPTSSVALVWVRDRHTDLVEEMIGIVRGRTANSTRGRGRPQAPTEPPARTPARNATPRRTPTPGRGAGPRGGTKPRPAPGRGGRGR